MARGGSANLLYYGDNLPVLREHIPDEVADLIYLDPPFNSNADYNVLFGGNGNSQAQIRAFADTWHWGLESERSYADVMQHGGRVADMLEAFRRALGDNDMMAYLAMMAVRLIELRRVLKPTGSIYLHCDPIASHYLKILLDAIFGKDRFLNEISWKRTTAHNDPNRYGRITDRLLFYSKSATKTFNRIPGSFSEQQLKRYKYEDEGGKFKAENLTAPHFSKTRTIEWRGVHPGANRQWRFGVERLERLYDEELILLQRDGRPRKDGLKEYLDPEASPALQDVWTDISMSPTSRERLGYDTQKPLALLERVILSSSNQDQLVLDPFCGCGTAVHAAQKLGRRWIGIDITHLAIGLIEFRLKDAFGITPTVIGAPEDEAGAHNLWERDPFQFEAWAVTRLLGIRPNERKTGDRGIDGVGRFYTGRGADGREHYGRIYVSVKGGQNLGPAMVRDFRGVMEREKADIGVFICLRQPTREMVTEAASAGRYREIEGRDIPRIQFYRIADYFAGRRPDLPPTMEESRRRAPEERGQQPRLGL
jgi:site-specific DNA-methyltransferase (adenine-specific)